MFAKPASWFSLSSTSVCLLASALTALAAAGGTPIRFREHVIEKSIPGGYRVIVTDLNRDGANTDRWVDPATGQQVHVNAGRGDNTVVLDLRTTKFIEMGADRRLGLFAEFFNLFNTVNLGNSFQGNGSSATFRQPTGSFVPGIGYPRGAQLGVRFLF